MIESSEHEAVQRIRAAIHAGSLDQHFRAGDIKRALGIRRSASLLVGHCQDTGRSTAHFIRVGVGVYRLRNQD
jgi:hypothetical protein